jgi:thioredoxin reductase
MFDVLVIGGGVSGVSCALVLGSAQNKVFAKEKKLGLLHIKKQLLFIRHYLIMHTEFYQEN